MKKMARRYSLLAVFALFSSAGSAQASSIFVNPSFETGDFTGWITQDNLDPFFLLSVLPLDGGNTFGWPWNSTPTDGNLTAFSGWDGGIPGDIFLAQDLAIPAGSTSVSFDWRAAWDLDNFSDGAASRLFQFVVQPSGGGAALFTQTILTAAGDTFNLDTGQQTSTIDISAFSGQNVRLAFLLTVPGAFTGPAQFQLDNVTSVTTVPEPASLFLIASGLAGVIRHRRRART